MKKVINKEKSKPAKKPIVVNKVVFNLLTNLIDRVRTLERKQAIFDISIQDYNLRMRFLPFLSWHRASGHYRDPQWKLLPILAYMRPTLHLK
jgi:hypothetical protein